MAANICVQNLVQPLIIDIWHIHNLITTICVIIEKTMQKSAYKICKKINLPLRKLFVEICKVLIRLFADWLCIKLQSIK